MSELILVPYDSLEQSTLMALVEEFVTRDGTDYGDLECATEQKVQQVLAGLADKRWLIVFDPDLEQCNIVTREMYDQYR